MKRLLIFFVWFLLTGCSQADEPFDLQGFIDQRILAGEKVITVPPGRYRIVPQNKVHLRFSGVSDLTVIADGVEMICTETTRAIGIENCTNLTLRGLTIDYDPLPFTQGKIIEISPDRKSYTLEIESGFPSARKARVFKLAVFSPDGELKYASYYRFKLKALSDTRLQISGLNSAKDGGERVGDQVVVGTRDAPGGFLPHAVFCNRSTATVLENITLFTSPVFGFFETHCDGSIYRNCKIDRKGDRLRSLNADAFHSKFAKKGPQIIGCKAMWQGDDCVNICGAYHLVAQADGDTLRVLAKQEMDIEPGDPVELITVNGQRLPNATVLSVIRSGKTRPKEAKELRKLNLLARVRGFLKESYEIKLNRKVDLPFGSVIASINRMGNGFSVKNCTFGNNRSRGILIKASNGEISGNRIVNCGMQAIKISPEYQWLESGSSRNVAIIGNTVINSGLEAIQIYAFDDYPVHSNLRIVGNNIRTDFPVPIDINGVDGCVFKNNIVKQMDGLVPGTPVVFRHCENVLRQD